MSDFREKLMFLSSADRVDVSGAVYTRKIGVYPIRTRSKLSSCSY